MWTVAADSVDLNAVLIPAIWGFLGIVVTVLGSIAVQALKSRSDRTTSSAPAPVPVNGSGLLEIAKDIGQLDQRADDNDDRDDMQDRRHERHDDRLDALERWALDHDPDWGPR